MAADVAIPITVGTELSLTEFLALPDDTRAEIVDGVVRPMIRSNQRQRNIQSLLAQRLREQADSCHRVLEEEIVVLSQVPATTRIPDVVVIRAEDDWTWDTNNTPARDVALAVEVVSRTTATADRHEKPVQYALAGIPGFWRVETEPEIVVVVHQLVQVRVDGVAERRYEVAARVGAGGTVTDDALPWASVEVDGLGRY